MTMDTEHNAKHGNGSKYEKSDFHTDFVWSSAWTLLGLMFAGLVAAFFLFAGYGKVWSEGDKANQPSRLAASLPARPPGPHLQELPAQDMEAFRRKEAEAQSTYGWVEPNAGVVRIPIERAMELTLERGLPARPAALESRKEGAQPTKR